VFCLPSHLDAVPWVVLEAMATATPVVTSDVGSLSELAGDGGLAVPVRDVRALREALGALLADAPRREAMGAAGRARAEARFDARRNSPRLLERLAALAAPGPEGRA
jgi:glycosyltransferase involved in cell wall biosynthesis